MSIFTFKGGIHPPSNKIFTKTKTIDEYLPQEGIFAIPLSQHIGAPAIPIVKVGERVLVNQKIGEANGYISANVHSSVSGIVKAIEKRRLANGSKAECVIIENDGLYEKHIIKDNRPVSSLSREDKIELIKEAGVVGMGGAGFPTHVKLSPKNPDDIEYIIVNGAECEPYLTSDYRRMIEKPEIIVEGLKLVLSLFKNAKGIIAVEDNKLDAVIKLNKCISKERNIKVKKLFTKYPQGNERSLIYALTNRKLNSKMLPADVGCIVHNVDTIFAIYNAIVNKQPLINRVVTISGDGVRYSGNYLIPVGIDFETVLKDNSELKKDVKKIINGGPMMGIAISDLSVPVTKESSAILCFRKDEINDLESSNCINCGRCVSACPSGILPCRVAKCADLGDEEGFIELNGMDCVECGSCSYICPAKRQVTQSIKTMKKNIQKKK